MADVKDVCCVNWDTPVEEGGICRVAVQFLYNGPATTKRVYAAIGNKNVIFDEVLAAYKDLDIPASYPAGTWDSYTTFVDIPITSDLDPAGSPYDLYGKVRIAWVGWEVSPIYENVIEMGGAPPPPPPPSDYRNLTIQSYQPTILNQGDVLQIVFGIDHIGEAESGTLHVAVGKKDTWFNEEPGMTKDFSLWWPASYEWDPSTIRVNLPVGDIPPGTYEFYGVLRHVTGADRYVYSPLGVLTIGGGVVYEAEITSKLLDILDQWRNIPVASVVKGTKTRIKIISKNTGDVSYHVNCQWQVKDPSGVVIEPYSNTAINEASPGESTEFVQEIWDTWELPSVGDYTIEIWISAQETGELLAYQPETKLCTVVPSTELEAGKIDAKKLEVSGISTHLDIPVSQDLDVDSRAKVHVYIRNTGDYDYHARCKWTVKDPFGDPATPYDGTSNEWISPGEEHHFYEFFETFTLTHPGPYTIKIELFSHETGKLLDEWQGGLCTVVGEAVCDTNEDCPPGYICVNGVCVLKETGECTVIGERKCVNGDLYECTEGPENYFWMLIEQNSPECEEKAFPWIPVALIGGGAAIALAAAIFGREKKKK